MSQRPLISIRDLSIVIDGREVLRCEAFDLHEGDKALLTSRSGGGKSVFLKCLAGLLPLHHVTSGKFISRMDGTETQTGYGDYARQRDKFRAMSFVFQDAINSLHPYRTVAAQLRQGRPEDGDAGLSEDLARFRLGDLDMLGTDRFRDRLSGGQCQRVSLLLAAGRHRQVVLLDEPLTDIDAFSRREIETLLLERLFADGAGKTVLLVTHDALWMKRMDAGSMRHFAIENDEVPGQEPRGRLVELQPGRGKLQFHIKPLTVAQAARQSEAGEIPDVPILQLKIARRTAPAGGRRDGFHIWPLQATGALQDGITLRRGEGVALYGLSGSGKSFLLRCMAGLWPKAIMGGVSRRGQHNLAQGSAMIDLARHTPAQLASNIQYIFQNNRASVSLSETLGADIAQMKRFAVRNTMALLKAHAPGFTIPSESIAGYIDVMIEELWQRLHIPAAPLKTRETFKLSGLSLGMLRRYSLIRALVKLDLHTAWRSDRMPSPFETAPWQVRFKPRVLLADEISRGLDSESLFALGSLIRSLKETAKLSVVVVSHENSFTAALAERIHLVVDGFVMPSVLTPSDTASQDDHLFKTAAGLPNPIYGLYCPSGERQAAASYEAPDVLGKLHGATAPGCVVHRMLKSRGRGCPNLGAEGCIDAGLVEKKVHGVCS